MRSGQTGLRGRRPLAAAVAVCAVAAAGLVVAGTEGFSAARVALASGQAWVASSGVGQIQLIDGSTEERAASVTVARAGERLGVVQAGPDALVVNRSAGTVRRIRGSTYDDAPGDVTPLRGGRDLQVYGGPGDSVFAVDSAQGAAVVLDRDTMRPTGQPVSMAARLDPRSTVIDPGGALWTVDGADGSVVRLDRAGKHVTEDVADPGVAPLVLVRGEPAVVDVAGRAVRLLDPDSGEVTSQACLDVDPGTEVAAGGSSSGAAVHVVVPSRGVLLTSDLASGDCSRVTPVAEPGSRLGAPVETSGRVFVPDYGTGTVTVVDVASNSVVGSAKVLAPGLQSFELLPRDGFVFYNDPSSDEAGVVRLDASARPVQKYDRKNLDDDPRRPTRDAGRGADEDGGDDAGSGSGTDEGGDGTGAGSPAEDEPEQQDGKARGRKDPARPPDRSPIDEGGTNAPPSRPVQPPPAGPVTPTDPDRPPPQQGGPGGPGGPVPGGPGDPGGNPGPVPGQVGIQASEPWETGRPITFRAVSNVDGQQVTAARWTFDAAETADGVQVDRTFGTPGSHAVQLVASLEGVEQPAVNGSVTVVDPAEPENRNPEVEPLTVLTQGDRPPLNVQVTARADDPDPSDEMLDYTFDWGDGTAPTVLPSGTGESGAIHTYNQPGDWPVTLTVTDRRGGSASVSDTVHVPEPPPNQRPRITGLTATPDSGEAPLSTQVRVEATDPEGDAMRYRFVWSHGRTTPFQAQPVDAVDNLPAGDQSVTVRVQDTAGNEASDTVRITVAPRDEPPVLASFTVTPDGGRVDLPVTLDATGASADTVRWRIDWDDGDTETSTDGRASHTYTRTCSCRITVTVEDAKGQDDTARQTVSVTADIHSSGRLQSQTEMTFDLDTGNGGSGGGADVGVGGNGEFYTLLVYDGATAEKVGSGSYNTCADANPAGGDVRVENGDVVCVRTGQGRLAMVTIDPGDQGIRYMDYTTWSVPQ